MRILEWLDPVRALAGDKRGHIRAHQIAAFKQLLPAVAIANGANAVLLLAVFWHSPQRAFMLVWAIILTLLAAAPLLAPRRARPRPPTRGERGVWRVARDSGMLALVWGAMLLRVFPSADETQKMIIAIVAVGMMCGGSMMLATLARAAFAFTGLFGLASAAVLLIDGRPIMILLAVLLASYLGVLMVAVRWIGGLFVAHLLAKTEASEKSEVIGLLLHEFEQGSADWLWQIDARGGIVSPSPRFVTAFGMTREELEGADLLSLLRPGDELETLRRALASGEPFRDVQVPRDGASGERWLSFTGRADRLIGSIAARGVASDVTEERRATRQISYLAHHDSLTGLPNRFSISMALDAAIKPVGAGGTATGGGLIFVDLDEFKSVNDTLGHDVGDRLLVAVAERLRNIIKPPALVGRLGGDEFAIVFPRSTAPADITLLSEVVLENLHEPFPIDGRPVYSGCSLGVRLFEEADTDTAVVMKHADLALYAAKDEGRSGVKVFRPAMEAGVQERTAIEQALRVALERREFRLLLQPYFEAKTGDLVGAEALIRWQHPELGLIAPDRFIDVAVRAGMIDDIGLWVVRTAVHYLRQLPSRFSIAVNVSAGQLKAPRFVTDVLRVLAHNGVDPGRLEIEITESALLEANDHNLAVLTRMSNSGLRIALDDFGTGFSSLNHLRMFAFDKIKIDKSFISELVDRDDCRSIVHAVTGLARSLNMATTVEGVETEAQLAQVLAAGCRYLQGYLFSKPVTFEAMVARWPILLQRPDAIDDGAGSHADRISKDEIVTR